MKKIFLGICGFLLIAAIVSGFWATTAVKIRDIDQVEDPTGTSLAVNLTDKDMARQSELIVTGECAHTQSVWVGRTLVTLATITVNEVIKGEDASTVTVVLPGGVDANRKFPIAMTYPGAPQIIPDEEVFLFLTGEDMVADGYAIMGFSQGKYSIVENDRGEKVVSRDLTKMRLKDEDGVKRGKAKATPLSEFKEEIKGYLRRR